MGYCLLDSRAGTKAAELGTNDLNNVDDDWGKFVLLMDGSPKYICHHANNGDYGENCIVADTSGRICWEWFKDDVWRCDESL